MQQAIALYGVSNDTVNCYLNTADSMVHCGDGKECIQLTEERWESEYKCIENMDEKINELAYCHVKRLEAAGA